MKDKEHKELISDNHDNEQGDQKLAESAQVPPSLLPTVLQRLGLSPETSKPEISVISVKALVEQLHSADWEERLNAVRALERLESGVPVELLATSLKDDDASVRAAALSALRNAGPHVPLHLLVAALHDPDWHVREMAVLALGKQGRRVPQAVLQTALHDDDHMVREAATLALQWHATSVELEISAAFEGQRWEQHIMQQKESHQNGHTTSTLSDEDQNTVSIDYSSDTSRPMRVLYEQQQAYAAQSSTPNQQWQSHTPQEPSSGEQVQIYAQMEAEQPPSQEQIYQERTRDPQPEPSYEYNSGATTAHGEKLTSLPTRSRRTTGWWIVLLVIVALVFFMFGRVTDSSPAPSISIGTSSISSQQGKVAFPSDNKLMLDDQFASQARQDIASGLSLSPDDIAKQLNAGRTLQEIAADQGVNVDQLHKIELNAISNLIKTEVKAGRMDENDAQSMLQRFQDNPDTLDKIAQMLFLMPDTMQNPGGPKQP
ncbi:hypothetical protein KSF_047550 [Reticulibacter mediterranei]|uniref:HEAT repeat domain-containing protein n=1 Tax=Reticulibacter mediterranei TaxID=2778369 RepID=A0A8J3IPL7_9CHLR|nr:HEAT repeat domain-containing protein [Reticulibacter mediterranei]GHO94707.1 hypothetical protein KSF_047550 [Reticulibacter mediterranei]